MKSKTTKLPEPAVTAPIEVVYKKGMEKLTLTIDFGNESLNKAVGLIQSKINELVDKVN